jgi:thioredoxin-related protein
VSIHINTDKERSLAQKYFIRSLPTIWFLDHDESKITNVPGYIPPDIFLKILEWLQTGVYKEMNFKQYMDKQNK